MPLPVACRVGSLAHSQLFLELVLFSTALPSSHHTYLPWEPCPKTNQHTIKTKLQTLKGPVPWGAHCYFISVIVRSLRDLEVQQASNNPWPQMKCMTELGLESAISAWWGGPKVTAYFNRCAEWLGRSSESVFAEWWHGSLPYFQHSSKHLSAWQEIDAQFLLWSGLEYGLIWSLGILETCLQAAEFVNLPDNWASPALTQWTNSERCGKWTFGVTSQGWGNSMPQLALQMVSTQCRHHTEKGVGAHKRLLRSLWNPWSPTLSVRSPSISGAKVVTSALCCFGPSILHEDQGLAPDSKMLWVPLFTKKDENISSAQEVFLPRDNNYKLSEGFGSLF